MMNALHHESRYHGLREDLYNDLEAHPITSQTDEFQFVEATQTIGCNWCCTFAENNNNKPKGGYDLFLRFLSEDFRTPEVLTDFHPKQWFQSTRHDHSGKFSLSYRTCSPPRSNPHHTLLLPHQKPFIPYRHPLLPHTLLLERIWQSYGFNPIHCFISDFFRVLHFLPYS